MKFIFLSLLLSVFLTKGFSQQTSYNCPVNIDFEQNDLSNWKCYTGTATVTNSQNIMTFIESGPVTGRHQLISSTTDKDEYGEFQQLCPYGDKYSVKLGNKLVGGEAESMSYTFQIPPLDDTFSLTYYYAVVFQDPNHAKYEQPRFFVSAYDAVTGALINCASYDYVSTASIPGFQRSTVDASVWYKDWTPASIDFSGLAGRTVKLEFKTADCTLGGHFGYAYFDVSTGCGGVIANAAICAETNNAILNAPYGFQTYTWWDASYSTIIGYNRTVTISPSPPATATYHVDMIPYPGYGCRDTAFAKLTLLPVPDTPVTATSVNYCQFDPSSALKATGALGNTILWYNSAAGGNGTNIPPIPSTAAPGTFDYYVSQKKIFGCESFRTKATVAISATPLNSFSVNSARQCQDVNSFAFINNTSNTVDGRQYLWNFGDGKTDTSVSPNHVYDTYGNFTIRLKVLNPPICSAEKTMNVVVVPKPLARFTYPALICDNLTPIVLNDVSTVPNGIGAVNKWWWQIDGKNPLALKNPGTFFSNPGPLPVKLVVTTTEGCKSDTNTTVLAVHYSPAPAFKFSKAVCSNETVYFTDQSAMPPGAAPDYVVKWNWEIDNVFSTSVRNPSNLFAPGAHHIKLTAESNVGCKSTNVADSSIFIYSKPYISLNINDSCVYRNIVYSASTLPGPNVANWYWDMGYGMSQAAASFSHRYTLHQTNVITLMGETKEGCKDTLLRPFTIFYNRANAGRDTIVAMDEPLKLDAGGDPGTQYTWTPATGLSDTHIRNPVAIYNRDQLYELNTLTKEGCDAYSKIFVRRYKGPELYVPTAFTPNDDKVNDLLHVFPVGIRSFGYFAVYNRFGQMVYRTTDYHQGWDGRYNGNPCEPGNYVYYTVATDYKGNPLNKKGSVVLLK